ncbi:MAG: hypothetical protein KGI89_16900 [Euryarchaeota archaeon]|nr:hypothetical protein [Euryarchaeota archaeon]
MSDNDIGTMRRWDYEWKVGDPVWHFQHGDATILVAERDVWRDLVIKSHSGRYFVVASEGLCSRPWREWEKRTAVECGFRPQDQGEDY